MDPMGNTPLRIHRILDMTSIALALSFEAIDDSCCYARVKSGVSVQRTKVENVSGRDRLVK